MKISFLAITLLLVTVMACSTQESKTPTPVPENADQSEMEKSQTIELKKGELFLAVVGHQMQETDELLKEYFATVFPPAQKHGFSPLGKLPIDEVASGSFTPNEFVGLFKWPGMDAVQGFLEEVSHEQLVELRVNIWSELKQHVIAIPKDTELTFKENKVYEVKMLWADQTINRDLITNNGGTLLLNRPITGYEDLGGNDAPTNLLFIEWDTTDSADAFRKVDDTAFKKEEAFYTHFAFPEES